MKVRRVIVTKRSTALRQMPAAVLAIGMGAALVLAVLELHAGPGAGLAAAVAANLGASGVGHPVTGVLLNFRGYDTWLELGVLFVAVLGVLALGRARDVRDLPAGRTDAPMLGWVIGLVAPLMVLMGGYLLWRGSHAPGGAFQAGAVLGAVGVVLRLAGVQATGRLSGPILRTGLAIGFGVFGLIGLAVTAGGRAMLEYPPGWAAQLILLIEVAATVSIALTLAVVFAGAQPREP